MMDGIQGGTGALRHHDPQKRFKRLDKNGDGALDVNELAGIAKRRGQDPAKMLADMDTNKDGKVDSSEMQAAAAKRRQDAQAADGNSPADGSSGGAAADITTTLMNILKQLKDSQGGHGDGQADADGDGDGSGVQGMGCHKPSKADTFAKLDADGDGMLSPSEFAARDAQSSSNQDGAQSGGNTDVTVSLMNMLKHLQTQGSAANASDPLFTLQEDAAKVAA